MDVNKIFKILIDLVAEQENLKIEYKVINTIDKFSNS
jgi:hypothetical protein